MSYDASAGSGLKGEAICGGQISCSLDLRDWRHLCACPAVMRHELRSQGEQTTCSVRCAGRAQGHRRDGRQQCVLGCARDVHRAHQFHACARPICCSLQRPGEGADPDGQRIACHAGPPGKCSTMSATDRPLTLDTGAIVEPRTCVEADEIVYGTMTGADILLLRLTETYDQIERRAGVKPLLVSQDTSFHREVFSDAVAKDCWQIEARRRTLGAAPSVPTWSPHVASMPAASEKNRVISP